MRRTAAFAAAALVVAAGTGCSVNRWAVNRLGDALAAGGSTYAADDDPELVGAALPFGLKTIESLLDASPRHRGLLLAACSGFTQYAYVYVAEEADVREEHDLAAATALRARAGRLYRRALGYGLRGLELDHPGIGDALRRDPVAAAATLRPADVPMAYWTAAAWGAAIGLDKNNADLTADLPAVEALMRRALALEPGFSLGSIHDFFITYEASQGHADAARAAFERALAASKGHRAAPYVSFAEAVPLAAQDRKGFEEALNKALAIDPNAVPELRLANIVAQRRARWLLARVDTLFIE